VPVITGKTGHSAKFQLHKRRIYALGHMRTWRFAMVTERIAQLLRIGALALFSIVLASCGSGDGKSSVDAPDAEVAVSELRLVFSDEFGDPALDVGSGGRASKSISRTALSIDNWRVETGYGDNDLGWGNSEWQLYRNSMDNLYTEDGYLVIKAICEGADPTSDEMACDTESDERNDTITSARINTKDKINVRYGNVQARIKMPSGAGMWPAFWMLGSDYPGLAWPNAGEIDIVEMHYYYSNQRTTHFSTHWAGPRYDDSNRPICASGVAAVDQDVEEENCSTKNKEFKAPLPPLTDDFHVFELEWNENTIVGKIDGITYFSQAIDSATMEEFQKDYFLILNVAVGGTLGGPYGPKMTGKEWADPDKTEMKVDWVRVYERVKSSTATLIAEDTVNLPYNRIINTAEFNGGFAEADLDSTAVNALVGDEVLAVKYRTTISKLGGGVPANYSGIIFDTNRLDLSSYTKAVFSIDSSRFSEFEGSVFKDIGLELQDSRYDPANGVNIGFQQVRSSDPDKEITKTRKGDWWTFEIPLKSFARVNINDIAAIGFFSPRDAKEKLIGGDLYFDDIRFVREPCNAVGSVGFSAANFTPTSSPEVTVNDACAPNSLAKVKVKTGNEAIVVGVNLNSVGKGDSIFDFSPETNDETSTIHVVDGLSLEAVFIDTNGNEHIASATVDSSGTAPPVLVIDFEPDNGPYNFFNFAGGDADVFDNPDIVGNTSLTVARMLKVDPSNGDNFGGTVLTLDNPINISASNEMFTMKVWSARPVPVTFKLEAPGGDPNNPDNRELVATHSGSSSWEELTFDFTGLNPPSHTKIILIFDNGVVGDFENDPNNWTFYFDDLTLQAANGGGTGTGPFDVTLTVDMSGEMLAPSDVVFVSGSWDGFCGGCSPLTDNGDGTWGTTISLDAGTYEYKFQLNEWASQEAVPSEPECGVTIDGFTNRQVAVDSVVSQAVTPYNGCAGGGTGGGTGPFDVTLTVDMSGETLAPSDVVFVSGSWDGFCGGCSPLTDNGDGTWGTTISLDAGTYEYKFQLNEWASQEAVPSEPECGVTIDGFTNRQVAVDSVVSQAVTPYNGCAGGSGDQLAVNGSFETGDLSSWDTVDNGGTISAVNSMDSGSEWFVNLKAGAGNSPFIGLPGLGVETILPGDPIYVSFDMCGVTEGISGAVKIALLSQKGEGNGADRDELDLIENPLSVWTRYDYSTVASAGVTDGVSLQLEVGCGAVAGCSADVSFDNVSIILGGDGPVPGTASGESCAAPVAPGVTLPIDFEDGPYVFTDFDGGQGSVEANSQSGGTNVSANVGKMLKYSDQVWGGSTFDLGGTLTVPANSTFTMNVWSSRPVPVLFKLEGGPAGEVEVSHSGGSVWEELTFDFTGVITGDHTGITFIFDNGTDGEAATDLGNWTFYFDDIDFGVAPPSPTSGELTLFADTAASGWVPWQEGGATAAVVTDADAAYGDVIEFSTAGMTVVGVSTRTDLGGGDVPHDASSIAATGTAEFDLKMTAAPATSVWKFKIEGTGGAEVDLACVPVLDTWVHCTVPLSGQGDLSGINNVMIFPAWADNAGAIYRVDNLELVAAAAPPVSGELTLFADTAASGWVPWQEGGATAAVVTDADAAYGDVIEFSTAGMTVVGVSTRTDLGGGDVPHDASSIAATGTVEFDLKMTAAPATSVWKFKIEGTGGAEVDLACVPVLDTWVHCTVPLSGQGDLSGINNVMIFPAWADNAGAIYRVDNLELVAGGGGGGGGGDPFQNGDFETGDSTGWTETPDGGTITVESGTLDGRTGTWARLQAAGSGASAQDVLLTQELSGVSGGDTVRVAVDVTGELFGDGGVIFIELIGRNTNGDESGRGSVGAFPIFPASAWTVQTSDVTVPADISGGLTLQLKSSCGAIPGCGVDGYFDNVTYEVLP
jgi:beta-glucanase (GH16 family)